ncbi:uncharacterized [Tachysurus ichikawai]
MPGPAVLVRNCGVGHNGQRRTNTTACQRQRDAAGSARQRRSALAQSGGCVCMLLSPSMPGPAVLVRNCGVGHNGQRRTNTTACQRQRDAAGSARQRRSALAQR